MPSPLATIRFTVKKGPTESTNTSQTEAHDDAEKASGTLKDIDDLIHMMDEEPRSHGEEQAFHDIPEASNRADEPNKVTPDADLTDPGSIDLLRVAAAKTELYKESLRIDYERDVVTVFRNAEWELHQGAVAMEKKLKRRCQKLAKHHTDMVRMLMAQQQQATTICVAARAEGSKSRSLAEAAKKTLVAEQDVLWWILVAFFFCGMWIAAMGY